MRKIVVTPRGIWNPTAFLLAAGLLAGAAPLQAQDAASMRRIRAALHVVEPFSAADAAPVTPALGKVLVCIADANGNGNCADGSAITAANHAGPTVRVEVGALATVSPQASTDIGPSALIDFDAPLPIGNKSIGRVSGGLELLTAPGTSTTATPADVTTALATQNFRSMAFHIGIARYFGAFGGVRMYGKAEAGFATRVSTDPAPLNRVLHAWGAGIGINDDNGDWFEVLAGRNQVADLNGPLVYGPEDSTFPGVQLTLRGELAIPGLTKDFGGTKLSASVRGESVLNAILPSNPAMLRQDVNRVGLVARVAFGQPVAAAAAPVAPATARPPAVSQPAPASFGPPASDCFVQGPQGEMLPARCLTPASAAYGPPRPVRI